jgi:small-conductance mechanosensitive channel
MEHLGLMATTVLTQVALLIPKLGMAVLVFAVFWAASVVVRSLVLREVRHARSEVAYILQLVARAASIGIVAFGLITSLGTIGINVSALVAGLGLTGFALGFALRDVLSNLVAGILILLYRPFQIDDYISSAGVEGRVCAIDLRYTTLRKDTKKHLLPNSVLFTNTISLDCDTVDDRASTGQSTDPKAS